MPSPIATSTPTSTEQIRALLTPSSVAVIGASATPNSFGERAIRHFDRLGYKGDVHFVNPRYDTLRGRPCYPSIEAIPGKIDTAVVLVGAAGVPAVMEDLAKKACRSALVLGSGFGELGAGGDHLQEDLLRIARANDMRFVGPNTNGGANVLDGIPLGFTSVCDRPSWRPGSLAVISQSGSIAASFADCAMDRGAGVSYVLGIGNAIDLGVTEFLEFLASDPRTESAFAFIEGVPRPQAFFDAVKRFRAAGKTLVLLKVGRTAAGRVLAATHSGSIAGSWEAFRDIAQDCGAIVATSLDEALDLCTVSAGGKLAAGGNPRVGVVTTSGALSGLLADEASVAGLALADLGDAGAIAELEGMGFRAPFNPLDYGQALPNAERKPDFRRVCELMLQSSDVDALLVATGLTHHLPKMANVMVELKQTSTKPIYGFIVGSTVAKGFVSTLQDAGIPLFTRLPGALKALQSAANPPAPPDVQAAPPKDKALDAALLREAGESPTEYRLARWLEDCGLRYPERTLAAGAQDAAAAARKLGFPVALKVVGSRILHKSILGLIKLPLNSPEEVAAAYDTCKANAVKAGLWEGEVMVQRLVDLRGGVEILAAIRNDIEVGHILMVGVGGAMAEAVSEATIGPLPRTAADADRLIARSRVLKRLFDDENRGLDRAAFVDALLALGVAGRAAAGVFDTVEVNPLAVLPDGRGCWALDATALRPGTGTH